jgi:hypothetical protein
MDSGVMMYMPSFINIGSGSGLVSQTHREHGYLISLHLFLAYFPYFEKIKVGL